MLTNIDEVVSFSTFISKTKTGTCTITSDKIVLTEGELGTDTERPDEGIHYLTDKPGAWIIFGVILILSGILSMNLNSTFMFYEGIFMILLAFYSFYLAIRTNKRSFVSIIEIPSITKVTPASAFAGGRSCFTIWFNQNDKTKYRLIFPGSHNTKEMKQDYENAKEQLLKIGLLKSVEK